MSFRNLCEQMLQSHRCSSDVSSMWPPDIFPIPMVPHGSAYSCSASCTSTSLATMTRRQSPPWQASCCWPWRWWPAGGAKLAHARWWPAGERAPNTFQPTLPRDFETDIAIKTTFVDSMSANKFYHVLKKNLYKHPKL